MCVTSAGSVSHPSGSWLTCPEQHHCMMRRGGLIPASLTPSPAAMSYPPWGSPTPARLLNQLPLHDAEQLLVGQGC